LDVTDRPGGTPGGIRRTPASADGDGHAFAYYRITSPDGIVAVELSPGAVRAVVFRPDRDRTWTFNPTLATRLTLDDRYDDDVEPVDRAVAESWCRAVLNAELPTDGDLHALCEAGAAARDSRRWQRSLLRRYGRTTTSLGESTDVLTFPEGRETTFYAIYPRADATHVATLIVIEPWRWTDGIRAVSWDPTQRAWIFDPERSLDFLTDPHTADQKQVVDRETAVQLAGVLGTTLPDDDEIHRICQAAPATRPGDQKPTPQR
jgi:hypothetical protein